MGPPSDWLRWGPLSSVESTRGDASILRLLGRPALCLHSLRFLCGGASVRALRYMVAHRFIAAAFRPHVWPRLAVAFRARALFYQSTPQRPRIRYPILHVSETIEVLVLRLHCYCHVMSLSL